LLCVVVIFFSPRRRQSKELQSRLNEANQRLADEVDAQHSHEFALKKLTHRAQLQEADLRNARELAHELQARLRAAEDEARSNRDEVASLQTHVVELEGRAQKLKLDNRKLCVKLMEVQHGAPAPAPATAPYDALPPRPVAAAASPSRRPLSAMRDSVTNVSVPRVAVYDKSPKVALPVAAAMASPAAPVASAVPPRPRVVAYRRNFDETTDFSRP
jgi:hypothetical protein